MQFVELLELYKKWAETYSGFPLAIWDYNNAPRPARPYISLAINSLIQHGFNEVLPPNISGISSIKAQSTLILRVNAYGSNELVGIDAIDALENLKLSISKFEVRGLFDDSVSFFSVLNMTNLSQIINTGFEGRASMDTGWLVATTINDDVGLIEHVIANGRTVDYNGTITHEFTVEVQ